MRHSLYHLKLELYASRLSPDTHSGADHVYLPPEATDIFTTALPIHRTTPRAQDLIQKRPRTGYSSGTHTPETRPSSAVYQPENLPNALDALLLPERNAALRDSPSRLVSSPRLTPQEANKDWRFGPVTIDSIDMEPQKETGLDHKVPAAKVTSGTQHTRGVYVPSDTKTTEVGWGVVHLYKDAEERADLTVSKVKGKHTTGASPDFDVDKCSTLCILAVPSWMMPSDLLGFVGDQTKEDVSHFRLIRTGRANKYMVLMKFRSPKKARDWQSAWNGRLFSAMEPENCHVVYIKSVQFLTPEKGEANFPQNNADPFTTPSSTALSSITASNKPYAPPTPSLIELPTCPVCLERMDETTGLLTILCQHVFHCACLEKWRGSGCPVCRYTQSPSSTFPYPQPNGASSLADPECSVCASSSNLWICLICGNVGCGRYDSAHAYAHYEATSHCYAMDITSQHVWDYAGDGYVHRLIQNKDPSVSNPLASHAQRYIADLPHHPNAAFRAEAPDSVPREKMEAMATEYTYLLTSQLDSQRRYFEEQMQRAVDKASLASARAEEAASSLAKLSARLEDAETKAADSSRALAEAETERARAQQKMDKLERTARGALASLAEEKALAKGLVERNEALAQREREWSGQREGMQREVHELQELNRDLTIHLQGAETLRRLEGEGEEVMGGEAVVPERRRRRGR